MENEPTLDDIAKEHEGQTLWQVSGQYDTLEEMSKGKPKGPVPMHRRSPQEDLDN